MKLQIKKIEKELEKIGKKFWQTPFLILVFLLILDLIIGVVFFLKYYFLSPGEFFYRPLKIHQNLIKSFSQEYQKRELLFEKAQQKVYPELFQGPLVD